MATDDIQKVKETRTKDAGDWGEWPFPTLEIESVITGELRSRILAKLGRSDETAEMLLIETNVSSGYSEYTQEDECSIRVRIGEDTAWQADYEHSTDAAMARFLKEFTDADHS